MNKYILILWSALLMLGYSCSDSSDTDFQRAGTNSVYATFENGSGFFNPETSSPYGDTIKFIFSTHYPVESDAPTDITKMKLKAYEPVLIEVPGNTSGVVDLSKETVVKITMADGSESQHIVVGKIKESSEARIETFSLPGANLTGYVVEDNKIVGLVPAGVDLSGQKPQLTLSPHSTISPDTSIVQDFNEPVTYTVTAEDGTEVNYTVEPISPNKVTAGIRKGSGRLLWSKTLNEMGIDNSNHLSTSIAVDGKYLAVNTRNAANRYFNRFNGEYAGDMTMGGIHAVNFMNFYSTNDDAGNVLISNLTTAVGQTLYIYRWNGIDDPNPVKYIEWTVDVNGSQAGRKISIKGDLDGDALIYMGMANANNTILRWQVSGGVLQSQTPEKLTYNGPVWGLYADIVPEGTNPSDKVYLSASPSDFVYTDLSTGEIFAQVDLSSSGYQYNHSIDLKTFNHANYLGAINIKPWLGYGFLYDVTDPALLSTAPSDSNYKNVCIYTTDEIACTVQNGNATGDILIQVSEDGYKMILYVFVTNGGVNAYEFDCIDTNNLIE